MDGEALEHGAIRQSVLDHFLGAVLAAAFMCIEGVKKVLKE